MTLMETSKQIENILASVQEVCGERYRLVELHGEPFYQKENGIVFHVMKFPGEQALVVEYANNLQEAEHYMLEDGDRFYPDDYQTNQMLINHLLLEIEDADVLI